jgi:hypothetical protein
VRCVEVFERIAGEIDQGLESVATKGLELQSHGRVVTWPGAPDLHSQVEAFLQSAKLAIRETARLGPFQGLSTTIDFIALPHGHPRNSAPMIPSQE